MQSSSRLGYEPGYLTVTGRSSKANGCRRISRMHGLEVNRSRQIGALTMVGDPDLDRIGLDGGTTR